VTGPVAAVAEPNPWLPYPPRALAQTSLRLFCFPHAGGGASAFRGLRQASGAGIEICPVHMPGREDRRGERGCADMAGLVSTAATALLPRLDAPYALLGASIGSVIAFEVARYLGCALSRPPEALIVAACAPPGQAPARLPRVGHLADEELARFLAAQFQGIPEEILHNAELLEYFMPVIREDLELIQAYLPPPLPALSCPVIAFLGADDPISASLVAGWRAVTTGPFELLRLDGGHFAVYQHAGTVLQALRAAVAR
jgi:pyochelin biosynthesis protein PchC